MALLCLTESISATAQKQSIPNVSKIEIPCIRMVGASKWEAWNRGGKQDLTSPGKYI